eukprot:1122189_1
MADTRTQLEKYGKSLIIDELYNILNDQEIITLLYNLNQASSGANTKSKESKDLKGRALDNQLDDVMDRLNIRQKSRDPVFASSESRKQDLLQKYEFQSKNKAPPPQGKPPPESQLSHERRGTFILPAKSEILIQGFLLKKGAGMANAYKKRWFVLYHNNSIAYYPQPENAKSQKNNPLGEISLYHVTKLNKKAKVDDKGIHKYKFELVTPGRTFALKAEDANTYHSWIRHVTQRVTPTVIYQSLGSKKSSKGKKNWSKRYFSLVNYEQIYSELRYYETEKKKKFKGVIDLREVTEVTVVDTEQAKKKYGKNNKWVLELTTRDRVFVLSYKKLDLMSRWEDELKRAKFDDDITHFTPDLQLTPALAAIQETRSKRVSTGDDEKKTETLQQGLNDTLQVNPFAFSARASATATSVDDDYEEQPRDNDPYNEEHDSFNDLQITGDDDGYDDDNNALPSGWIVLSTDDGHPYYWEEATGQTTWTVPQ